jgi:hypothetical protein
MKAILTYISEVDVAGMISVRFNVYDNKKLLYTQVSLDCSPDQVEDAVRVKLADYQDSLKESDNLKVGMEISL